MTPIIATATVPRSIDRADTAPIRITASPTCPKWCREHHGLIAVLPNDPGEWHQGTPGWVDLTNGPEQHRASAQVEQFDNNPGAGDFGTPTVYLTLGNHGMGMTPAQAFELASILLDSARFADPNIESHPDVAGLLD